MTLKNNYKSLQAGFLLLLSLLIYSESAAQPWNKLMPQNKLEQGTLTLFDYQNAFTQYWEPFDVKNGYYQKDGVKQKAGGWKQFKRWEWYWEQRVDPKTGEFPKTSAMEAYKQYLATTGIQSGSGNWTSMGPSITNGGYAGLGRLNCIGFHPTDANTFYVGAAAGGIWKTTDGGSTWFPLSDTIPAMGISDIEVIETSGDDIIYIATGDRDHGDTYSVGVLKSTDGGVTWNETGLNWSQSQLRLVNRTLMDPDGNDTLYAATSIGLFQTIDAGTTWSLKTTTQFIDIEFQPGNTAQIYGSTEGGTIYRSTNYGDSWAQVYNVGSGQRTEIAVTADNPNVVYAVMSNSSSGLDGIHKSTDGGATFTQTFSGFSANLLDWSCDGSGSGGQGWYDLCIESDPNDENVVFIGGVNTWSSSNGGTNWSISTHWSGTCSGQATTVHADKHFFAYQNGTSNLFECNDGGLYKTTNEGSSWTHLGTGLIISQMYRLGVAQTSDDDIITGLQDNGTKAILSGVWDDVIGGDGMECLIDYTDKNVQYGSLYYGNIRRTTNHWASSTTISNGISGSGAWVTPYIIDKNDHETLYAGFQDVWKSTNRGNSWTQISNFGGSTFRSLAIANNSDYIYVATYNNLQKTTNGGSSWTNISSGLPGSSLLYISVKKDDPNTVWVCFGSFNSDGVYETTDGGSSWSNISSGLPQLPVNCVIEDTSATDVTLYAGTDVGIYIKVGDADWSPFFEGLPTVVVTELDIYYDGNNEADSRIRAATFGRGLWESNLYTSIPVPVADFVADNTSPTTSDTVNFTDLSINSPTSWDWEITPDNAVFVNGTNSESQNPNVRFDAAGFYTVTLTASNAAGSGSETKTDYIDVSGLAPETNFVAEDTVTLIIDPVLFSDLSINTPTAWDWEADPATITFMDGTDENSQNPIILFNEPGNYSISLTASNATGSNTETKTDYIEVVEVLSITATADPDEFCEGDTVFLEANPVGGNGNFSFLWSSNPAGFNSEDQYTFDIPFVSTTYTVEVADGFQESSTQVSVTMNEQPEIIFSNWPEGLCHELEPPVQLMAFPGGGIFSGEAVTTDGIFSPEEATIGWNIITYTYVSPDNCEAISHDSIYVDDCVGVIGNLSGRNELSVYPNPNQGDFVVESNYKIQKLELFNQLGVLIYSLVVNDNSVKIDAKFEKGIYYLKANLQVGNKIRQVNKKVVVR